MSNPATASSPPAETRLPGLDGLRAISVTWVVLFHISHHQKLLGEGTLAQFANAGHFGVSVFFVISGFLITWLLLRDENSGRSGSLRQFYVRRAFRILPAAFFHLLCVAVFLGVTGRSSTPLQWLACVFFFRNLKLPIPEGSGEGGILTAHFWSLSVEEQFYLFWPLLIRLLPRSWRLWTTVSLFLAAPFWKQALIWHYGAGNLNGLRTDLHYHFLLAGAALALAKESGHTFSWLNRRWSGWQVALLVALGLIFLWTGLPWRPANVLLGGWLPAISTVIAIKWAVDGGTSWAHRALNCQPMVWLGQLSYSIYLWQQFFTIENTDQWWQRLPWSVVGILTLAAVTHYGVEKPFLRLRGRLFKTQPLPDRR